MKYDEKAGTVEYVREGYTVRLSEKIPFEDGIKRISLGGKVFQPAKEEDGTERCLEFAKTKFGMIRVSNLICIVGFQNKRNIEHGDGYLTMGFSDRERKLGFWGKIELITTE